MSLQRVCVRVCMCNSTAFYRSCIFLISGSHWLRQLFHAIETLPSFSTILRQFKYPDSFDCVRLFLFDHVNKRTILWRTIMKEIVFGTRITRIIFVCARGEPDGAYLIRESEIEFAECECFIVRLFINRSVANQGSSRKTRRRTSWTLNGSVSSWLACFLQVVEATKWLPDEWWIPEVESRPSHEFVILMYHLDKTKIMLNDERHEV